MSNFSVENINFTSVEAVILDLDGTLYPKHHLVRRIILRELFFLPLLSSEQKSRKAMREECFSTEEDFYAAFFTKMSKGHCFSSHFARWWYFYHYMPLMVRLLCRFYNSVEWLPSLIAACKDRNIPVVVFSDYGCVNEKLNALHIDASQFALIISAPELGGLKPCTEVVKRLVSKLSVTPSQCLFVGDREDTDGKCASSIGAKYLKV